MSSRKSSSTSAACSVCGKVISRKADLPRHMRLHSNEKEDMMLHCPVKGCTYKNLQRSNVDTHFRTHTGEKLHCPTCDFATSDPGSMTRHKKRTHGYEPKPRRKPATGKITSTKSSLRHTPYSRDLPTPIVLPTNLYFEFLPRPDGLNATQMPPMHDNSFTWDKRLSTQDIDTLLGEIPRIPRPLSPRQLLAAAGAGKVLESEGALGTWEDGHPSSASLESVEEAPYPLPHATVLGLQYNDWSRGHNFIDSLIGVHRAAPQYEGLCSNGHSTRIHAPTPVYSQTQGWDDLCVNGPEVMFSTDAPPRVTPSLPPLSPSRSYSSASSQTLSPATLWGSIEPQVDFDSMSPFDLLG